MEREKTCEQRIDEELKKTIEWAKEVNNSDDPIEKINEDALALSKTEVYKLELSYGGPQDYIEFEYDPKAKELAEIRYHFLDWFDGAVRYLRDERSEEFKVLEELFHKCILIE